MKNGKVEIDAAGQATEAKLDLEVRLVDTWRPDHGDPNDSAAGYGKAVSNWIRCSIMTSFWTP
jgi:hypothetical protein